MQGLKKNIKLSLLVMGLAVFTAFLFSITAQQLTTAFSYQDTSKAFYKGTQGVSLTFDISWGDENAEAILNTLEKEKYQGVTFFLSGEWAERHQHVVEKIINQKHEIGILGYAYKDYTELSDKEIRTDINKAIAVFEKLGVKKISLVRPPTGDFDDETLRVVDKMGLTLVQWSINTHDWKNPGTKEILASVADANAGDIVLLHASDSALQTAKALPQIISRIREAGLQPLTISEMLSDGKKETKEISKNDGDMSKYP